VMGVQIVIPEAYQGKGISPIAAEELKNMCLKMGIKRLIIPIRPTLKSKYPLNDIDNYIKWKTKDGLPFDPWLRVHVRKNAEIINACKKAVEIRGTVKEWETWTNMKFPESGKYVVEGKQSAIEAFLNLVPILMISQLFVGVGKSQSITTRSIYVTFKVSQCNYQQRGFYRTTIK